MIEKEDKIEASMVREWVSHPCTVHITSLFEALKTGFINASVGGGYVNPQATQVNLGYVEDLGKTKICNWFLSLVNNPLDLLDSIEGERDVENSEKDQRMSTDSSGSETSSQTSV